ncbi:hypothetical protein [Arsenicicoccus bolidensis]|uniref:Uncharacterized protein n=1 Tax=Arsenicicoccus bolidensis TaxID=229480 RepID=A0ABS9Q6I1_9MICO|nr:hypothetical protein [Arsenicicoccus bolidensis]MCG7322962.1 hypothetical protein [Arsenicicoccus bolidensis]
MRKIAAVSMEKMTRPAPLPHRTVGRRRIRSGTSGAVARSSTTTNAASSRMPARPQRQSCSMIA